jgi:hypothetical protein
VIQRDTEVDEGADPRLYEVRSRLRFVGYNPQEIQGKFEAGDYLRVVLRNACGMGIDVVRERDGRADMVWPEEVQLVAAARVSTPVAA